ncbi:MAG: hypothetical protein ACLQRH_02915 [Acidimicrobiales bacterium]
MTMPPYRRVVSGRAAGGSWAVLQDGVATATESFPVQDAPFDIVHLWNAPTSSLDTTDATAQASMTEIFDLAPGSSRFVIESMPPTPSPSGWHRTSTIDYEYIVSGKIDLAMQDGSVVTLEQGDVNVQLGGVHQWWNRYEEPCVLVIVMVGVEDEEAPGAFDSPAPA